MLDSTKKHQIAHTGEAAPKLRHDIQALRGVAVLLVVLYHAGLPGLPAGYLGVDVFFVISGFLITGIIRRGTENGSFSFRQFYYRRANRLLPAAYVVIAATVLAAPWFLSEQAIDDLATQVIGALTFTVNFVFWQQAGYFEAEASTKPLLHFWSLAIEEQYYLLMPVFLLLVPHRFWLGGVGALLVASFGVAIWQATTFPDAAFYLLPSRLWELALGSIGALLPARLPVARLISLARIPAIIALFAIPIWPTGSPHPGADALIVCVATLIILLGHSGGAAEKSPPVRALSLVGDFSYSLYLVHWPVIVFTRSAYMQEVPTTALASAVAISLVLAWILYRFVEEPFRRSFVAPRKMAVGLAAASIAVASLPFAAAASINSDTDWAEIRRHNRGLDRSCAFGDNFKFTEIGERCRTNEHPKVLVVGDSYAMAWISGLAGPLGDVGLAQATMAACDPLFGMARFPRREGGRYNLTTAQRCLEFHQAVLEHVRNNESIEIVVLAARFQTVLSTGNIMLVQTADDYEEHDVSLDLVARGLVNMVDEYRRAGRKVVVVAPPPANGMNIGECLERLMTSRLTFDAPPNCSLSRESVRDYRASTFEFLNLVSEKANVDVLDVYGFLCGDRECRTLIDGVPIYRDAGHLSVDGSVLIGERTDLAEDILTRAH